MKAKGLKSMQDSLKWPTPTTELPLITWENFQEQASERTLILVSGFVHDVTSFANDHPGGANILLQQSGKDSTAAFFGGIYEHSNAAHNLLAMMRVAILAGGMEQLGEHSVPPSQMYYIGRKPLTCLDVHT